MCGFQLLQTRIDLAGFRWGQGLHLACAGRKIGRIDQGLNGDLHKVRITQIFGPVGIDPLFDLSQQVDILRAIVGDALKGWGQNRFHLQELDKRDTARAGRRGGDHVIAIPRGPNRLAPDSPIADQIGLGDDPLDRSTPHLRHDQIGSAALIKALLALGGDALQRGG